MIHNQLSLATL